MFSYNREGCPDIRLVHPAPDAPTAPCCPLQHSVTILRFRQLWL